MQNVCTLKQCYLCKLILYNRATEINFNHTLIPTLYLHRCLLSTNIFTALEGQYFEARIIYSVRDVKFKVRNALNLGIYKDRVEGRARGRGYKPPPHLFAKKKDHQWIHL